MNHIETTETGRIWHTTCRKCGTQQKVNIGRLTVAEARAAVATIDRTPMECPGGFHTEPTGWERLWHLDEMLAELARLEPAAVEPVHEVQPVHEVTPIAVEEVAENLGTLASTVVRDLGSVESAIAYCEDIHAAATIRPEAAALAAPYLEAANQLRQSAPVPQKTTQQRIDEAIFGALHSFQDADERWRNGIPADDATLQARIAQEFGIQGGFSITGTHVEYHGGTSPHMSITLDGGTPLELRGESLRSNVRRVLGAVYPTAHCPPPTADPQATRYTSPIPLKTIADTGKNGRVTAAINIRAELAHHFPGVKFEVRGESFSMGDAIRIHWNLGPTDKEVDAICDRYQECDFDGMDDSTNYRTGAARKFTDTYGGAKYITTSRHTESAWHIVGFHLCKMFDIDPIVESPTQKNDYYRIGKPEWNHTINSIGTIANRIISRTSFPASATAADITGVERTGNTGAIHIEDLYNITMPRFNALNPSASAEIADAKAGKLPRSMAIRLLAQPHGEDVGPSGDFNLPFRQEILQALTGTKPPKAKAGIGVVGAKLAEFYGITTYTCGADKDEQIRDGLRRTIFTEFPNTAPAFQQELREISELGGEPIEKVYAKWCVYAFENESSDMSAVLGEFRTRHAFNLGLSDCGTKRRERFTDAVIPSAPKPEAPKPALPTAKPTPLGDSIRRIPAATFAAMSGRDGEGERTAFAAWVDAGSRTGDWRSLYKQYAVSLTAPAVKPEPEEQGACILTDENMHTADDCSLHDHEQPEAPAGPWAHWKPGDKVQFTPAAPMGRVVTGTIFEIVNGGDGVNIFCPVEGDPRRVLRVWARDGALAEAPEAPAEPEPAAEVQPEPPTNIIAFPSTSEAQARIQQALARMRAAAGLARKQ